MKLEDYEAQQIRANDLAFKQYEAHFRRELERDQMRAQMLSELKTNPCRFCGKPTNSVWFTSCPACRFNQ